MSEQLQLALGIITGLPVAAALIWGCHRWADREIAREDRERAARRDPEWEARIVKMGERDRELRADQRRFVTVEAASINPVWTEPAGGWSKPAW